MSVTQSKTPEVILLASEPLKASDASLVKLVEFMGGVVTRIGPGRENQVPAGACVVAHAASLARLPEVDRWLHSVARHAANCLFYGFDSSPGHAGILSKLTSGSIAGAQPAGSVNEQFSVPASAADFCRQFSGLSFGNANPDHDFRFVASSPLPACSTLIALGQNPFLFSLHHGECRTFLLAGQSIGDLDIPCSQSSIIPFFSRLAPVIMYLRHAFQKRLWHNDNPQACFIIDDPLLKPRHGFLKYQELFSLMQKERFSTSIAFIPWNYRRSQKRIAQMFGIRENGYSLCVHGCDHTAGEFGETNAGLLREKAERALVWMSRHQELWDLPFDKVMVFPGGIFSAQALRVLAGSGYLGAVNSTAFPVDSDEKWLPLRELLDIAVLRFSNFPLFVRRYPKDPAEIAFDLLLGRPALLVEHHDYFRDGYDAIAQVVRQLNTAQEKLEWTGLEEICSTACLKREAGGDVHVRFYSDRFRLRNNSLEQRSFVLWRRQGAGASRPAVHINGQPAEFNCEGEYLKLQISLDPAQAAQVAIHREMEELPALSPGPKPLTRARVFARRHLCEFRDNYVQTSRLLNRVAARARRMLAGTETAA